MLLLWDHPHPRQTPSLHTLHNCMLKILLQLPVHMVRCGHELTEHAQPKLITVSRVSSVHTYSSCCVCICVPFTLSFFILYLKLYFGDPVTMGCIELPTEQTLVAAIIDCVREDTPLQIPDVLSLCYIFGGIKPFHSIT